MAGKITRQELSPGLKSELDKSGNLASLTTTDKSSLVGAVNEVDGEVGTLSTLTTTDKSSLVGAVNEVNAHKNDYTAPHEYQDEVTGVRYKLVMVDGEPYMEVTHTP